MVLEDKNGGDIQREKFQSVIRKEIFNGTE